MEKEFKMKLSIREVSYFFLLLWLLICGNADVLTTSRIYLWLSVVGFLVVLIEGLSWRMLFQTQDFDILKLLQIRQGGTFGEFVRTINSFVIILVCKYVSPMLLGIIELARIVKTGALLVPDTVVIGIVSIYSITKLCGLLIRNKEYEEE